MPNSVLVVAGETSGERHAAGLIRELRRRLPAGEWDFFGSGGPAMSAEGVDLLLDVSKLAAIGPIAAMAHAGSYLRLFRRIQREAVAREARLAILVDFPDFNLPLAGRLKKAGIPVCYFISPQVWAWRRSRVKQIARYVDLMLVIFPFEEGFYREQGVEAFYIGNPTAARLRQGGAVTAADESGSTVALLPGSRKKEVDLILPVMLDAGRYLSERMKVRFLLQKAPSIQLKHLAGIVEQWKRRVNLKLDLDICSEGSEKILAQVDCAMVKSGTSTLEAMILEVPFAMVYRLSWLSWVVLKPFVRTDTYCLANLVAGETVVPEFVQWNATGPAIGRFLERILTRPQEAARLRTRLRTATEALGVTDAYARGAERIFGKFLDKVKQDEN
ncbi:MAG: lipid-A-disaccharide synthase [Acidobacteriota bacterium]|nr:MAG: lipid-A-disaccharide synthase [Acidobacteriota bacterium]